MSADSLKDPVGIVGLPGIANVGRIAVESLIEMLDAQVVLEFFSDDFPPRVAVKNGISQFPRSSVSVYRAAPDEPHDLVMLSADYQPSSSQGVFAYADFVSREFQSYGVRHIYALAAYEQEYRDFFSSYPRSPRVFISASSDQLLQRLSGIQDAVVTLDGVINGANGFIPSWAATMYDMDGACLLGETLGVIKADYRAARAVLQVLSDHLGVSLDLEQLDEPVGHVVEFIEWAKSELDQRSERAPDEEHPSDRYIG
ncbi:MAG: PAC2 family protein [Candidatus Thorarchaeota archaeon]|nr:PAC2 family protein [Candidatus Thorarchaeota archaeon]